MPSAKFAFPALPLAIGAIWRRRAGWREDRPLQFCVVLTTVIITVLSFAGSMRGLYLLPALVPLSVLAGSEVGMLPRALQRHLAVAAYIVLGAVALALWVLCLVIAVTGAPPTWLPLGNWLPLDNVQESKCELVRVRDNQTDPSHRTGPTWRLLWSGHRPGDSKESHRLFAR